jgi:hypothetical protein
MLYNLHLQRAQSIVFCTAELKLNRLSAIMHLNTGSQEGLWQHKAGALNGSLHFSNSMMMYEWFLAHLFASLSLGVASNLKGLIGRQHQVHYDIREVPVFEACGEMEGTSTVEPRVLQQCWRRGGNRIGTV